MTVKTALQLINRFLAEDDFDADTQFCLQWFEQHGWEAGKFGEADTLARAKGTSVDGVKAAGVIESGGGSVRLLTVSWLPSGGVPRVYQSTISWYSPATHYANFVVTGTADGRADLIPRREIRALAGPPARTYHFQSFTIMVWNKNLLASLGSPPMLKPGIIGHS